MRRFPCIYHPLVCLSQGQLCHAAINVQLQCQIPMCFGKMNDLIFHGIGRTGYKVGVRQEALLPTLGSDKTLTL